MKRGEQQMNQYEIISRIPGLKKKSSNRYEGRCPCPNHPDKHPSFAVYINKDWINPVCFAGCSKEEILSAIGLEKKDLYIGNGR